MTTESEKLDPQWDNLPFGIVAHQTLRFFLFGLAIPATFALLTLLQLDPITGATADVIARWLEPIWPSLLENYERMETHERSIDANNYALFFLVMLTFAVFLLITIVSKYARRQAPVDFPNVVFDGLVILVGAGFYYSYSRSDDFSLRFTSPFEFFLDRFGLFYFRQYVIIAISIFAVLVIVVSLLRLFGRRPSETV